jgi:hypothetical protein
VKIDTTNKFLVGVLGDKVVVMAPPVKPINRQDALLLAAYLVAFSDENDEFQNYLLAVRNT